MAHYSLKASRKLAKGGLPNLLYVHASLEFLPEELHGLASQVTILLPWGSLLRAVAKPDVILLKNIASLCREKARVRIIFGYQSNIEQKKMDELELPLLTKEYIETTLRRAYLSAGFTMQYRFLKQEDLKTLKTTWAKKLAYGKKRQFIEINLVVGS